MEKHIANGAQTMTADPNTLTIAILANNVAEHLRPCFASLQPLIAQTDARTLVVLNAGGDLPTAKLARQLADTVVERPFENFSRQRNYALDLADTAWLLFIDADERLSPDLCDEISAVVQRGTGSGWRVPRRNFLFGNEMRYTGWWPDYQLRLMCTKAARYDDTRHVHEFPIIEGDIYDLLNPLVHFNYKSWGQFIEKQRKYAPLEAEALYNEGVRARPASLVGQPLRELRRRLLTYSGWRDGAQGIALSLALAVYKADVYRRLLSMSRKQD